jgi:hypothetical protein
MSNEEKRDTRTHLRRAIKDAQKARRALEARREANVHSVDDHALHDAGKAAINLARQLIAAGGSLNDLDSVN